MPVITVLDDAISTTIKAIVIGFSGLLNNLAFHHAIGHRFF